MAFVRRKLVKGIPYLYLVENKRVGGKVRQTILRYLGREDLHRPFGPTPRSRPSLTRRTIRRARV